MTDRFSIKDIVCYKKAVRFIAKKQQMKIEKQFLFAKSFSGDPELNFFKKSKSFGAKGGGLVRP